MDPSKLGYLSIYIFMAGVGREQLVEQFQLQAIQQQTRQWARYNQERVCQSLLCSVLGICPKEMFTRMCEELELEASLKLHLHRKENEKLKFNNRRILKGLTHILHMDHGDHTLTLQGPWRPHTYYTCTMETTQPLNMHHGDHTSTTHKPCMNTHPHHTDYSRTHTRTKQIMHLCITKDFFLQYITKE